MFKKLRSILSLVLVSLICFNVPGWTAFSVQEEQAIRERMAMFNKAMPNRLAMFTKVDEGYFINKDNARSLGNFITAARLQISENYGNIATILRAFGGFPGIAQIQRLAGGDLNHGIQDLIRRIEILERLPRSAAVGPAQAGHDPRVDDLLQRFNAYADLNAFNRRFDTRFAQVFDGAFDARLNTTFNARFDARFTSNEFNDIFNARFQRAFNSIFNGGSGFDFNLFDRRVNELIRNAGIASAADLTGLTRRVTDLDARHDQLRTNFDALRREFDVYSSTGAFKERFDTLFPGAFDTRFDAAFHTAFHNVFQGRGNDLFQQVIQGLNGAGFAKTEALVNLTGRVTDLENRFGVLGTGVNDLIHRFDEYSNPNAFNDRFDARFNTAVRANSFEQIVENIIHNYGDVVSATQLNILRDDLDAHIARLSEGLVAANQRVNVAVENSTQALALATRAIADHAAQNRHNDAQRVHNDDQQRHNDNQRGDNERQAQNNEDQRGNNEQQDQYNKDQVLNNRNQETRNELQQNRNAAQQVNNEEQTAANAAQQGYNDAQNRHNINQFNHNELQRRHNDDQAIGNTAQENRNRLQNEHNANQNRHNDAQRNHNELQRLHNDDQRDHNDAQDGRNIAQQVNNEAQQRHNADQRNDNVAQQARNLQAVADAQRAANAAEVSELHAGEFSVQAQNHADRARTSLTNVINTAEGVQTAHEAIIRHMTAMFGGIPEHIKTTGDGAFLHITGTETLNLEPGLVLKAHSASGAGGAAAVRGNASLDLPNVQVFDNKAGTFGGAFIVGGDGKLSLRSSAKDGVIIAGNKAGGKDNSIHFTGNGEVKLNTINEKASIKIYDPMTDDGATVNAKLNVMGPGTTKLYATSSLDNTNIDVNGTLQLKNGAGLTARTITVSNGSQFSTVSGKRSDINAQTLRVSGNIAVEVFGDGSNDTVNAGNVMFDPTSSVEINLDSRRFDEVDFEILRSSAIAGNIGNVSVLGGGKGHLMILRPNAIIAKIYGIGRQTSMSSMSDLTKNQKAVAIALDNMSSSSQKGQDIDFIIDRVDHLSAVNAKAAEQALSQLNGYFLANVIRDITNNNADKDAINSRMNTRVVDDKADVWGEIKGDYTEFAGDANSLSDHKDTEIGAIIGYDRYLTKGRFANKLLLGAYSKINKHYVSQSANNDGEMTNAGLGLIASYNENTWETKAIIDGSYDLYSTTRHVQFEKTDRTAKANFSGMGMGFDIEGALKKDLGNQYTLRPYIGFEARLNYYGDIQEKGANELGLTVDGGSYNRMFARTGLGIKRNVNKYTWNANIEYKHLLTDTIPTIISRFGNTSETFESLGSEEGRSIIGVGAGSSYKVSDDVTIFANANINAAEKFKNVQGNIGTSYKFGMPKKEKRKLTKEEKEVVKVREQVNNLVYKKLSNKLKTYVQH